MNGLDKCQAQFRTGECGNSVCARTRNVDGVHIEARKMQNVRRTNTSSALRDGASNCETNSVRFETPMFEEPQPPMVADCETDKTPLRRYLSQRKVTPATACREQLCALDDTLARIKGA